MTETLRVPPTLFQRLDDITADPRVADYADRGAFLTSDNGLACLEFAGAVWDACTDLGLHPALPDGRAGWFNRAERRLRHRLPHSDKLVTHDNLRAVAALVLAEPVP